MLPSSTQNKTVLENENLKTVITEGQMVCYSFCMHFSCNSNPFPLPTHQQYLKLTINPAYYFAAYEFAYFFIQVSKKKKTTKLVKLTSIFNIFLESHIISYKFSKKICFPACLNI